MKKSVPIFIIFAYAIGAFSQVPENWEGKIMTVRGLIPADSMGITLPHEHLLIVHKGNYLDLTDEATAITELGYYVNAGGKTLAEASAIGIGRNPEGLKRISTATGANVIMSAGYYKDQWIPDSIKNKSVGQLTEIIINDIKNGINGIHSGFIKIAMSRPITPFEEKALIAAARAQLATGAAIDVHYDGHRASIADRHHVLDVFENEGVDLTRVYLSHCVPYIYLLDDYMTLAQRGCYLAFDMTGLEVYVLFEDELKLAESLNTLIDAGYLEQLLISQDVCFSVCYVKNGGYGYAHILNNIVPQLNTSGITDEQIDTIMVENPKRVLPFKSYTNAGQCVNSTYTATTGTISDNSGLSDYLNDMSCSKLIQPLNCSSVVITFTEFNTEPTNDVLTLYDGPTTSSPILGQFSGSMLPSVLESTGGSMLIVFNTNGNITKSGWKANYYGKINTDYSGPCLNEIYTAVSGTLTDNSGPSNYSGYMSCQKLIEVPGSSGITLQFTNFATEPGNDIVRVYDGNTTSSPILGEFSGTALPPVLTSTGGSMLILFITDYGTQAAGWSANYTSNTLSVTPESRSISSASGITTFTVTSNIDWSVSESSNWLTATKTDANTLTVSYDENISLDSRSAEITVIGAGVISQNIMVNQSGVSPALSVTPESRSISSASGTTTFTVTSNIDWSVSESSNWLTATKTDANTITVSYDENISLDSRSAEITISGTGVTSQNIMVNQSGVSPTLSVTPGSRSISFASGTATFTVTSNINWSVSESSSWLTATKTDTTTLTVSYDENISVDSRSAEITVSGTGVTSQIIMVNQNGVSPTLSVTPVSRSIGFASGTTTFTVTSNIDWSVSESSSWLTAAKTDTATLTVSYDENASQDSRYSEITVSGEGVNYQSVYIIQEGAITSTIKQISEIQQINVFPNPVSNKTWLTYPKGAAELIEIYEPSGRLIIRLQDSDKNGETEIDFSGLNSGLYIYRLIDEEGNIYNGKILKE
jgi:predicted metal-dependent phosphotriesterase family hydrolase